jgi:predicted heme/steroid binding protein
MYTALDKPRFIITSRIIEDNTCFLVWDFKFYMKKYDKTKEQTIRGGSHLILNAEGKIVSHRDYWDAAEELYEKLPVVGALMRWLKKRANS